MLERDVVVVGAGPVGLAAALAVRALGRPVTLVEAGAMDRVRPGSRAIFLHRFTLQVLERIRPGLGHELSGYGLYSGERIRCDPSSFVGATCLRLSVRSV